MTAEHTDRDPARRDDGRGDVARRRRWLRLAAVAAVVAAFVVAGRGLVPNASEPGGERDRPGLHRWDLVGCYHLRVGPWRASWRGGSGARGRTSGTRNGGVGTGSEPATAPELEVPASSRPPTRLMLLPDSVDRWGRALSSRRAVPLDGAGRPARSLRWTVHGDTLWLVWSEEDTRAGVALRRSGDGLAGRVRTVRGADSLDATAPASARPINCWTRAPERFPGQGRLERR